MTTFWNDKTNWAILKGCLSSIINDVNEGAGVGGLVGADEIIVFVACVDLGKTICMEVYDATRCQSRMRFSGMPQRKDSDPSEYESLPPVKKGLVNLVDFLFVHGVQFKRLTIRLGKQKWQLLGKITGKGSNTVKDKHGGAWAYGLETDFAGKNMVFENYVEWLEGGSKGSVPHGKWDGCLTLGVICLGQSSQSAQGVTSLMFVA